MSTLPALSEPSTASPVNPALFASAETSAAFALPVTIPRVAIPRSAAAYRLFTGVDSTSFSVAGSFENHRAGTQSGIPAIATAAKSSSISSLVYENQLAKNGDCLLCPKERRPWWRELQLAASASADVSQVGKKPKTPAEADAAD
jgi:hypothetical protein